ncbi:hypothetical protein QBC35DRAFT_515335 [Podospora australis]|uniref:Luciferase-like domain-containing protein n=1 Tax=Podospora australis TaxID=1536484 RepID=A0AAN7AIX3_9PEZI|nr:hypothetical protein QBC35DRAFT_515335 [Podospora australis]
MAAILSPAADILPEKLAAVSISEALPTPDSDTSSSKSDTESNEITPATTPGRNAETTNTAKPAVEIPQPVINPIPSYPKSRISLVDRFIDQPRALRVAVIGGGLAGITAGILLPAKVPNIQLTIYEKNHDFGGTWLENTYPGVRCDIPSHVYQATFEPKTDWTDQFAPGAEIRDYWQGVAKKHDVYRFARFHTRVEDLTWDATESVWQVKITNLESGEQTTETADFVLTAIGRFNAWKLPDYPGINDYKGILRHASHWDNSFDVAGKNVAVIGNGASGIQLVANLQKQVKRLDHYARNKTWIAGSWAGDERTLGPQPYTEEQKKLFAENPQAYLDFRKELEDKYWRRFGAFFRGSEINSDLRQRFIEIMKERLKKKPELLDDLVPDFSPNCRRLTPGPGYLEAISEDNVSYIRDKIARFTETGIVTVDGAERTVDAVFCATGANVDMVTPFPITAHGKDLRSLWDPEGKLRGQGGESYGFPYTYMGLATPGFPNLLFVHGPHGTGPSGTVPHSVENQLVLYAKILRKAAREGIKKMEPKQRAADEFVEYSDAFFVATVLSDGCSSWYNGGRPGGRIHGIWPGSAGHVTQVRREPRWEDWEYEYLGPEGNRFAWYFGNGWTSKEAEETSDMTNGNELLLCRIRPSNAAKVKWYRSTFYNITILGLCNFAAPGVWTAMNSLGAGGAASPGLINAANALTFSLMVVSCFFSSVLVKYIGIKGALIFGTIGYAPYAAGLYTNNRFGTEWLVLVGAALCGISAGVFWAAEASIAIAYPEPWNRGKALGYWLTYRLSGQILGGAINLGVNVKNDQAGKVSYTVFLVFIALQCAGPFVAFFLNKPADVQRKDGKKVNLSITENPWFEIKETTRMFLGKPFLLILLFIGQAVFAESVFFTYLTMWFSVRSRALGSFLSGIVAVISGNILGYWIDRTKVALKTRARTGFWSIVILQGGWWTWATIMVTRFQKTRPTLDWADGGKFGEAFGVFIFLTVGFQLNYLFLYFVIHNLAKDEAEVIRYAALLRGTESAWQALSYGLESLTIFAEVAGVYMSFGLWAVSIVPAWLVIRNFGAFKKQIFLNAFDMSTVGHLSPGQWRNPTDKSATKRRLDYWINLAKLLERGGINALFLADTYGGYDTYEGSVDECIRRAAQWPMTDPTIPISAMAAVTKNLSFAITASTSFEPPYLLAKRFSSLDHFTQGRIGWNIVTSWKKSAFKAIGLDNPIEHDERYRQADEYLRVLYKLWESSWSPTALVADPSSDTYVDPAQVRTISHQGKYYSLNAKHIVDPSPQRTPFLFQAGTSSAGSDFASTHAEAIFVSGHSPSVLRPKIDAIRKLAASKGRDPRSIKVFATFTPIIAATDEEAQAKFQELKKYASTIGGLVLVSGWTGIDLSKLPLDKEITAEDSTEAQKVRSILDSFVSKSEEHPRWTPRLVAEHAAIGGLGPVSVGSAATVADELERWVKEADVDGFNIGYVTTPGTFEEVVDLLVPELRRRGIYPDLPDENEEGWTAREKIHGRGQKELRQDHVGSTYKYDVYQEEEGYVPEAEKA